MISAQERKATLVYLGSPLPPATTLNTVKNLPYISVNVMLRAQPEDVPAGDTSGAGDAAYGWRRRSHVMLLQGDAAFTAAVDEGDRR